MKVPEVFSKVIDLMLSLGFKRICDLPACAEHQIDKQWWIAVNGHSQKIKCSHGPEVPPFSIYIEFNGWPGGIIDAGGGCLAAGAIANEDALIRAVEKASGELANAG